jgi:hypothetical protein
MLVFRRTADIPAHDCLVAARVERPAHYNTPCTANARSSSQSVKYTNNSFLCHFLNTLSIPHFLRSTVFHSAFLFHRRPDFDGFSLRNIFDISPATFGYFLSPLPPAVPPPDFVLPVSLFWLFAAPA